MTTFLGEVEPETGLGKVASGGPKSSATQTRCRPLMLDSKADPFTKLF
jgi:hypothetical protein